MTVGGTFAVLATVVVLSGCGAGAAPRSDDSGVVGSVLLGPECPVEQRDSPCPDATAPLVEVVVYRATGSDPSRHGPEVARGTTAANGLFSIDLDPGRYVVTADAGMYCPLVPTLVRPHDYTHTDISCDTGIR